MLLEHFVDATPLVLLGLLFTLCNLLYCYVIMILKFYRRYGTFVLSTVFAVAGDIRFCFSKISYVEISGHTMLQKELNNFIIFGEIGNCVSFSHVWNNAICCFNFFTVTHSSKLNASFNF